MVAFAFFFALALFCSGQSAGITATLAGQVVGEGFMNFKISVGIIIFSSHIISVDPQFAENYIFSPSFDEFSRDSQE